MRKYFLLLAVMVMAVTVSGPVFAETIPQTREQRLDQAVVEQKITLDDSQKAIVTARCEESKKLLTNLRIDTDTSIRKRLELYGTLQKDLQAMNLRFARQAVDASELDLLSGKLQQNLDEFTVQADAYGTAISDAIEVSCGGSPERVKAAVVVTRAQFNVLAEKARDLKSIMNSAKTYTYPQLKKRLTT